jgi:hypothetical protein
MHSVLTELLFVLLAAVGLMSLGCLLFIRCLFPTDSDGNGPLTLVPAAGDAHALDLTVHRLLRLRRWGLYHGRIAVVDCGLNEEGRTLARLLCSNTDEVLLCDRQGLSDLIP